MSALRRPDRFYAGYAFDLDGTIYLDEQPVAGARETLELLRRAGSKTVFITNKPLERSAAYAARLRAMGIPADDDEVVSSIDALLAYLADHPPTGPIMAVSEPLLREVLAEHGYALTDRPDQTVMVVVAWDRTFDYAKLERAFLAVRAGARIVATNPDPYCPTRNGGQPDCAAMLAAIEACTGARAEAVVGKPSRHMAQAALQRLGVAAAEVALVGDRLLTDVRMAHEAGMVSVLVLSGATSLADLSAVTTSATPDFVITDVSQLNPSGGETSQP